MLLNILTRLNWIDFIFVSIFIRILYVAAKNGFVVELFKLIGITFTAYVSLHYYIKLSDFIIQRLPKIRISPEFLHFFILVLLVSLSYSLFVFVRKAFCNLVKMEAAPILSKWGGLVLGLARGILTAGMIIVALLISTIPYLNTSVRKSYSGRYLFNTVVNTYSLLWNGLMSKFMTSEKFNPIREIPGFQPGDERGFLQSGREPRTLVWGGSTDSLSKIKSFDSV